MKKRGYKKGQFFLIAAVVIIVAIVSIVTISNYTQEKDIIKLYDLGEELGIESQHVLDYGTYNELDEEELKNLMLNFIRNYASYIEEENINIYFIFGDKEEINVVAYQDFPEEDAVKICFEEIEGDCSVLDFIDGEAQEEFSKTGGEEIDTVIVTIGSYVYEFELTAGQNFYFVIAQEIGDEKIVVSSEDV